MIKITVDTKWAIATGPFPFLFYQVIGGLSGRKTFKDSALFKFEASPANIRLIKDALPDVIDWIDANGTLADLRQLEGLATQHNAVALEDTNYTPRVPHLNHMEHVLALSWERKAYALLLEMGLCKTAICIHNSGMLYKKQKLTGVLVLAPKGVHRQWVREQIPEHLDPTIPVHGIVWRKKDIADTDMVQNGLTFLTMNIDAIRSKKAYNIAKRFLQLHAKRSMMIVDDSHSIKGWNAQRTKAALELGDLATYKRINSGTPISKNILDAWSQFKFLDSRILGHPYITTFKHRFCKFGGWENRQIVGHQNLTDFYRLIAPHSYRLTKKEATNLPEKMWAIRQYDMSDVTRKHYTELRDLYLTEFESGQIVSVPSPAVAFLRLQQIVCGYLPTEDGGIQLIGDERIQETMEIIDQVEGPVIIWTRFIDDIKRLEKAITEREIENGTLEKVVTYYGDTKEDAREEAKRQFLSGEARYFIATAATGGPGLNLQGKCQTAIYYSNSFNALDRWQSEDRTHRIGMLGSMTYFDLVATGSIDRAILRNLRQKKSFSDFTLDELRAALSLDPSAE